MNLIAFLLLIPAITAYSISQLVLHDKFIIDSGFWNAVSWKRKYKVKWLSSKGGDLPDFGQFILAPNNWYYRFFKIKYKERWPTSSTFTVFLTDGYHLSQFLFLLFLSASFTFALGFTWLLLLLVWILVHIIHFLAYKLFQK